MSIDKPIAIDLFAGCGGLTKGLRDAGFNVVSAVEIDHAAAETYRWNNSGTHLFEQDIRGVSVADLVRPANGRTVDLLAGCAPCQGFSHLTVRYKQDDPRNELLLVMADLIDEIKPTAVMMENVPGLTQRGKPTFDEFLRILKQAGYDKPNCQIVQMADYGVPQSRRRLVLLAGLGFNIRLPEPTHSQNPKLASSIHPWRTVRDQIENMGEPVTLRAAVKNGGPQSQNWHVVRDIRDITKQRLDAAEPGQSRLSIDESLRPDCHKNSYTGFRNVYGRMDWDKVAPTITSGCTTSSKGRFGHPDKARYTISVREAALLQSFPKNYKFVTDHIDSACNLIGNAVPPVFAEKVARKILSELGARA